MNGQSQISFTAGGGGLEQTSWQTNLQYEENLDKGIQSKCFGLIETLQHLISS